MRPNQDAKISSPNKRTWVYADGMIRGSRTMITTCRAFQGTWDGQTYKGSHSRQELRLHGSPFSKTTAYEDAVISNLMRDLMSEARQCRSGADHGTRIKRCGQAGFINELTMSKRNQRNGSLTRGHPYCRGTLAGLRGYYMKPSNNSHIMDKVTKQVKVR